MFLIIIQCGKVLGTKNVCKEIQSNNNNNERMKEENERKENKLPSIKTCNCALLTKSPTTIYHSINETRFEILKQFKQNTWSNMSYSICEQ